MSRTTRNPKAHIHSQCEQKGPKKKQKSETELPKHHRRRAHISQHMIHKLCMKMMENHTEGAFNGIKLGPKCIFNTTWWSKLSKIMHNTVRRQPKNTLQVSRSCTKCTHTLYTHGRQRLHVLSQKSTKLEITNQCATKFMDSSIQKTHKESLVSEKRHSSRLVCIEPI